MSSVCLYLGGCNRTALTALRIQAVKELQAKGINEVNIVIANAAVNLTRSNFSELSIEDLEETFNINVRFRDPMFERFPTLKLANRSEASWYSSNLCFPSYPRTVHSASSPPAPARSTRSRFPNKAVTDCPKRPSTSWYVPVRLGVGRSSDRDF